MWTAVKKSLNGIVYEMVATGRLQSAGSRDLINIFLHDVVDVYQPDDVLRALQIHRKQSPFWPHVSDIEKIIHPPESKLMKELREMRERRERAEKQSLEYMGRTTLAIEHIKARGIA